jgi:hypothetical protein
MTIPGTVPITETIPAGLPPALQAGQKARPLLSIQHDLLSFNPSDGAHSCQRMLTIGDFVAGHKVA